MTMKTLCDLLVVEGGVVEKVKRLFYEISKRFDNPFSFLGKEKRVEMFDSEAAKKQNTQNITNPHTSVYEVLCNLFDNLQQSWDLKYRKELTNQATKANVFIKDTQLIHNAPINFLLWVENELKKLKDIVEKSPVLDSEKVWETMQENHIYHSNTISFHIREEKKDDVEDDKYRKAVGRVTIKNFSGCISEKDKEGILKRIGEMQTNFMLARQIANTIQLVNLHESTERIFKYILDGKLETTTNTSQQLSE